MGIMESKYVKLKSMNKIAWLYMNNCFEDHIDDCVESNRLQVVFVYKVTEEFERLLKEYRDNQFLRFYCESFKSVKFAIAKYRNESV